MACTHLHFLPVVVFLWFPITFVITYIISVLLDHVNPLFPYISDTGTFTPESCLFGQLISIGIILLAVVMYVRYRQTRELYQIHNLPYRVQKLNKVSVITGLIGVFGVSIVGNFQETNIISVHLIGALIGFGLGTTYLVLQTVISYNVFPMAGKHWILYARVVLACLCVVAFLFCVLFALLSIHYYKGINVRDLPHWSKSDGGWELHVVSSVCEWLTAGSIMTYVLTFAPEFRNISFSEPVVHVEDTLILNPAESANTT